MQVVTKCFAFATLLLLCATSVTAQPIPGGRERRFTPQDNQVASAVARLMTLDTNQDKTLTIDEISDRRLHRVIKAADINSDNKVTAAELTAYFEQQARGFQQGRRGPGFGGPGGPGPGAGPGGPFGAPPRPGTVLPEFLQRELRLSKQQTQKLAALQAHVDSELSKILTRQQQESLQRMSSPPGGGGFPPGTPGNDGRRSRPSRPPAE